jgi:hypothetical protein
MIRSVVCLVLCGMVAVATFPKFAAPSPPTNPLDFVFLGAALIVAVHLGRLIVPSSRHNRAMHTAGARR